ncbi:hypothetical protein BH24PSE2_BH24PSE2_15250 [soil metagenome]
MRPRAGGEQWPTLLWTLGALALAIVPHVPHLPVWTVLLTLSACAWRLLAELRRWRFPPRGIRFPLALGVFGVVVISYRTISGVEAGSALLTVMMAMKLLESRTLRDQRVLLFIALFLIMAGFLYGQSLWLLPYTGISVWAIIVALLQTGRSSGVLPARRAIPFAGRLLAQALPIMVVLFVLFPRVPGPFWALPAQEPGAASGLDDKMTPGSIAELSLSDEVAFRVKFQGDAPPPSKRYWRGPVLHVYDSGTWSAAPHSAIASTEAVDPLSSLHHYRVTLEPHRRRWLFALEMPQTWSTHAVQQTFDYQLLSNQPVRHLFAYDVRSAIDYRAGPDVGERLKSYDLRLSADNPRTRELARRLRVAASDDRSYILRVLDHFRKGAFEYTLEPPLLGTNPIDRFLFNTRQGFCGHYASAFTYLMRAGGVPARIVTGYLGGERNPIGDYYIVRQSDAHAWSEVWLEGSGWTRVDPTIVIAPGRLAPPSVRRGPTAIRTLHDNALAQQLRQIVDALDNQWNQWVIDYDMETQKRLLTRLGVSEPDWRKLIAALSLLLAAVLGWLAWYLAREFRPRAVDPVSRLYARFCRKLARHKLARHPHEGPVSYADRIATTRPKAAQAVEHITRLYVRLRYETAGTPDDLQSLRRLVAAFRP